MHITTRTLLAAPPVLLEPVIRKLLEKNDTHSHDKYSDDDYLNNTKFNPSMAIIIVVLLTAFFFMGFFSLYVRRCTEDSSTTGRRRVGPGNGLGRLEPAHRGLDKEVIESFPVFTYDLLKGLKTQTKEIMECAVCLNDFADDEQLRLLPKCGHAFHPECIDMWLSSNTTCPVCRTSLVPDDMTNPTGTGFGVIEPVIEPVEDAPEITVPVPVGSMSRRTVGFSLPTSNEGSGRPSRQGSVRPSREGSLRGSLQGSRRASEPKVLDRSESPIKEEGPGNSHSNLSRSYSTGHSLVRLRKDMGEERSTEWFISTPKGLTPASHKTCTYAINQAMALHSKSQGYNIGASKFSRFPFFSKQFSFVRDGGQQQQTAELQNSGSIRRWYEKRFKSERNSTEMDPANFRRSLSERTGVASDCVFNPEGYNPQSHEHQEDAAKAYILNLKKTLKRITGIDDESPSSSNTVVASPVIAGGSVSAKGIVKAGSL